MELAREILVWALCLTGGVLAVTAGIGLLRLPDFFARIHGGSCADTGALLILAGLMIHAGVGLVAVKLGMILYLLLVTSPTSVHALTRAAILHGLKPRLDLRKKQG